MSFVFRGAVDAMMRGELAAEGKAMAVLVSGPPSDRMDAMDQAPEVASRKVSLAVKDGRIVCERVVFPNVTGDRCAGVVIVADGKPLVYIDEGFPVQPIGTDVVVTFADDTVMRVG